jgi:hypothetical protein
MVHLIFGPGADPELVGDQLDDLRLVEQDRLVQGGGTVLMKWNYVNRLISWFFVKMKLN